jgi:hypothetical protein
MNKKTKTSSEDLPLGFSEPRNLRESRAWYRYYYTSNDIVREAIDTKVAYLLRGLRMVSPPNGIQDDVRKFYETMCLRIKLKEKLIGICTEYYIMGNVFIYAIEDQPEYSGWDNLIILPPDQICVKKIPLSDESIMEFIPGPDPEIQKALSVLVPAFKDAARIPLNTDPYKGSFVYHLSNKGPHATLGTSPIESCLNTLILRDSLRKKQNARMENLKDLVIADRSLGSYIHRSLSGRNFRDETLKSYIEIYINDYLFKVASAKLGETDRFPSITLY